MPCIAITLLRAPPASPRLWEQATADAAAKAAHALKSMSYNVGARMVARMAGDMEASSRDGRPPEPPAVNELNKVLARTLSVLAAETGRADRPPTLDESLSPRDAELLRDLKDAMALDQLSLVYQPQVDRDGEKIVGVEALLRWIHPVRGSVSPALFIPLAEKTGLIGRITTWGRRPPPGGDALSLQPAGGVQRLGHRVRRPGLCGPACTA